MKTVPDHHLPKSELRAALRNRRAALDDLHRNVLDTAINSHLVRHAREGGFNVIAAFLAFDGEPDLRQGLAELERSGATLVLPVVHETPGRNTMVFRRWSADAPLQPNRYGILEPLPGPETPLAQIELILIPMVGWDRDGNRLGMGASYYDRALQPFSDSESPRRVGVAYAAQEIERVPADPWDVPLHAILNEHGWFDCPAGSRAAHRPARKRNRET
jgi:5-formyltetrahydrofolate cyclo-ligase